MSWFLIILLVIVVGLILIYNALVRLRVRVRGSWADVDVQLKRRYDLIPNLVETVKGYAEHERGTLEAVVSARNRAMTVSGGAKERAEAENVLTGALRSLFALAEAYPQLRAVESFTGLQRSLEDIETAIQSARRYYNAIVRDYNTKIEVFPSNLVATAFRFQAEEFFELSEEAQREAPKVDFGESGS